MRSEPRQPLALRSRPDPSPTRCGASARRARFRVDRCRGRSRTSRQGEIEQIGPLRELCQRAAAARARRRSRPRRRASSAAARPHPSREGRRYRGLVAQHRRQKRPSRSERHSRRHQPARKAISDLTVRLPERSDRAGDGDRAPRADELRARPTTRCASSSRTGAASTRRRSACSRRRRTAASRRSSATASASSPARSASTRTRRSSAAPRRWRRCAARRSCSTRCSGPRTRSAARRGRGSCSAASTATSCCSARSRRCRSSSTRSRQVDVRFFERKAPLEWFGKRGIAGLSPGTVVVAFSRRAVIGLAGELNQLHPGRVAVLYGAMPLASRREEIDRFLSGAAEVCASTDVLGHGVNLPCETLLFAETEKFDGRERRDLEPWEIAQIAGRAGRFGFHERGHVGVLTGVPWAHPEPGARAVGADAARRAARRPLGLPHRRHGPAAAAARGSQRHARRRDRAGAARVAARRAPLLERRRLADGRVDPAAARAPRRGARGAAPRAAAARARRRVEADAGADRRGRPRSARHARVRGRRRHAAAHGHLVDPRSAAAPRARACSRRSRLRARRRSSAGSRCSTRASPASRSRRRPRSRRPPPRASSTSCASRSTIRRSAAAAPAARAPRRGRRSATAASWRAATGALGGLASRAERTLQRAHSPTSAQHELRAAEERHRAPVCVAHRRVPELRRPAAVRELRLARDRALRARCGGSSSSARSS